MTYFYQDHHYYQSELEDTRTLLTMTIQEIHDRNQAAKKKIIHFLKTTPSHNRCLVGVTQFLNSERVPHPTAHPTWLMHGVEEFLVINGIRPEDYK